MTQRRPMPPVLLSPASLPRVEVQDPDEHQQMTDGGEHGEWKERVVGERVADQVVRHGAGSLDDC